MKTSLLTILTTALTLALASTTALAKSDGTIFQVSTYGALKHGVYDGDYTYKKLKKRGNFGLGTFKDIDGEMVALDGRFYQAMSSGKKPGKLEYVKNDQIAPFAEVIHFKPFRESNITDARSLKALEEMIVERVPNKNIPYAIEVDGKFSGLVLRVLRKQTKPYRSLSTAAKQQAVIRLHGISGSLVGFWFPKYWHSIAPAGLHLHFINASHTIGGHVLNVSVAHGTLKSEPVNDVQIYLPTAGSFATKDLSRNIH